MAWRDRIPDTTLWEPPGGLYCGPTAICTITGHSYYAVVRPTINRLRRRRANAGVAGMRNDELVDTLAALGWSARPVPLSVPLSARLPEALAQIYRYGLVTPGEIVLWELTRHYVTVQSNVVVDNNRIDSLIRHPARRQKAKRVWLVVPMPEMVLMRWAA